MFRVSVKQFLFIVLLICVLTFQLFEALKLCPMKTGVEKWLDTRLPIIRFGADYMSLPTPRNLNYWWTFGGILAFMLVAQIITGVVL